MTEVLPELAPSAGDVQYTVSFLQLIAPEVYRWPENEDLSVHSEDELVLLPDPKDILYKRTTCVTFKEGAISCATALLLAGDASCP